MAMGASYGRPPPPNTSFNYHDGQNQGHFAGYQAQSPQAQLPYDGQSYGTQGYNAPPGPYPAHTAPYQNGSGPAPGAAPPSYGPPPAGAQAYAGADPGYGYNRPHKRSNDWESPEYPRKRFSGQYANPPYQQGPPQPMRPPYSNPASPQYQHSIPNYGYQGAHQYPPPPASGQAGPPPATYANPPYGYQATAPPPTPPANGYAHGGYPLKPPEYSRGPQQQPYSAPPPPNAYPNQGPQPYPNQNAYNAQSQYPPSGPYGVQTPQPYQHQGPPAEGWSPMSRPPRQNSGPHQQLAPSAATQADPYQYMPPEGQQQTSTAGAGYDYAVPAERASDVDFVFPRGPKAESMGKSEAYFAVMQELDAERFSWDGALHPLPNEPIDPNFSIGKAGIITQHYAEPLRFALESSIELDIEANKRRALLISPFEYITSKYFDEHGKLRMDFPKAKDPLFTMPNHRLNEFISIQNARLFLDMPDEEPADAEEDVMSGLENALNTGTGPPPVALSGQAVETEAPPNAQPTLDPETARMLAELGVSVDGLEPDVKPEPEAEPSPPRPAPQEEAAWAARPPSPSAIDPEYKVGPVDDYHPEPRREYRRDYSNENRNEYRSNRQPEWRSDYSPERRPDYHQRRSYSRPDYRPDSRPDYTPESRGDERRDYAPWYSRSPPPITPPGASPYPNGRRGSDGTAHGSDFGPPKSPTPPPTQAAPREHSLKRKSTEDLEATHATRRRKAKVKGADTGSIYGRRD